MGLKGHADYTIDRQSARAELQLPSNVKLLVSVGGQVKYKPFGDYSFTRIAGELLRDIQDLYIVLIGPTKDDYDLSDLNHKCPDRFKAIGIVEHSALRKYLVAADIAIDSLPMSGGMALLDSISAGLPVLSLYYPVGQLDYVNKSAAYCGSVDDLSLS